MKMISLNEKYFVDPDQTINEDEKISVQLDLLHCSNPFFGEVLEMRVLPHPK